MPNHRELLIKLGVGEQKLNRIQMEEEDNVESARSQLEKMEWPEGNSVVKGVTSISDATSHENQLRRIDEAGAIVSTGLGSGASQ